LRTQDRGVDGHDDEVMEAFDAAITAAAPTNVTPLRA
jgi:hypothetical protein